tara:strand:- start:198 stop:872 length:675 start_codon:yes stop_codon:yes gene_type:complete
MNDSLFDDVTSLLEGDFGDDRILKQISRACKNNEVISNYERNYVQKLAEQYLGKKPEIEINPTISDVTLSPDESTLSTQTLQSSSRKSNNFTLKNSKLIVGIGGIALVIIITAAILFSTNDNSLSFDRSPNIESQLSVQTDLSSYVVQDLIVINGISNNSKIVNLSIENEKNELVWAEQISVKSDDGYSTLAIAGGIGWENSGTYTVNVDNGLEIKSFIFSFTS